MADPTSHTVTKIPKIIEAITEKPMPLCSAMPICAIIGGIAAMGNAPEEIKNSCQEVTLTNIDDGVAHFIYSLLRDPL
ncbi:HAD hydrolase family protein [Neobacillus novalis]|uniref:HAD hydrolase family protein n=1 Tax=Neobacillus novalis TaxID=220687 RepID=A0AA95SJF2_9BACI|nr:HAD hydrolase family protein [Neobacillus novalis]WHY88646.1 HAD hydrolase family protein [Neobacillus novalis]